MSASLFTNVAANISLQEAQINTLEQQIGTGYAVQSASQNPSAYETATVAQDQIASLSTDNATQATLHSKLGSISSTYSSVSTLYNSIQSVLEQALNGTTSAQDMQTLAKQVSSTGQQLLGLANSTAPDGTYLFGGSRNTILPFQANASGTIVYMGDSGQSSASITPDTTALTVADGSAFTNTLAGNGYSTITASATNTGTAAVAATGIAQGSAAVAFQAGSSAITLSFASGASGLTYTASQNGATLSTGSVTTGMTLQLAGQDFQINGSPAAGDSFTISPSRPQTAFDLLSQISSTLSNVVDTPASKAQTAQALTGDLATLAQYQQSLLTAQAQNGVTLQAISNAGTSNSNQQTALQSAAQSAVAVDMPKAITQLNQTVTAMQAAEKAFSSVQSLSLFQYI
ncbi:flagellar hook-associated protein FlgL [Acidisoma sp. C75]